MIVNITRSRRRTTDPRTPSASLVGWGVLQDVTGVAIAIVLLAILGSGRPFVESLVGLAVFGALVVAVAELLPLALHRLRPEHDLFLLVSVSTGLAVAGAGAVLAGIPIALAAFVAGLAISESHDAAEARRRLLPFRDVFAVFFFVAIGTLIDPRALAAGLPWLVLAVALVVVAKSAVAWLLVRTTGLSDSPLQVAVGLGQIGEFSFVLASVGPRSRGHRLGRVRGDAGGRRGDDRRVDHPRPARPPSPGRADPDRRGVNRADPGRQ